MPEGWVTGALLVEDTFTRADSGSLGSTEGGLLGPLAWSVTGTGVGVASNAAQVSGVHEGAATLTVTGRPRIRIEAAIDASIASSFAASNMGIVARGTVHNDLFRAAVTGYRPRLSTDGGATWRPHYTASTLTNGALRLDIIDTHAYAEYVGVGGSDDAAFTPVDWTLGFRWDANSAGDVLRWLDFRVWELKPEHEGGWQLGSVGWGPA